MGAWLASLPRTSLGWLVFIRIGVGLAMLTQGISKLGLRLEGPQPGPNWLVTAAPLTGILAGNPQQAGSGAVNSAAVDPIYKAFLANVVIPNIGLFSVLVTVGEILVGLSLIFGILTRLGAWGGIFLHLNYMLMKGWLVQGAYSDRLFILLELAVAFTAAGYVLGLDGMLRASLPAALRPLMSPTPDEELGRLAAPAREARRQPA
jgi:thiosulfate dehydrogenase [quinone] large subunit